LTAPKRPARPFAPKSKFEFKLENGGEPRAAPAPREPKSKFEFKLENGGARGHRGRIFPIGAKRV
jgi:hypothetical protein